MATGGDAGEPHKGGDQEQYCVQHEPTIDQTKLYTEISRTFFSIFRFDFQDESIQGQLCGRIFNFGPFKYFGRKMLKFIGRLSKFSAKFLKILIDNHVCNELLRFLKI